MFLSTKKCTVAVMHMLCTCVMQVTEKLLEAEDRKLKVLKAEIEASKHSDAAAANSSKVSHGQFLALSPQ